jgi:thioredoxin 2
MNFLLMTCPGCGAKNKIAAAKQHLGPRCGRCGQRLQLAGHALPVELSDAEFPGFIASAALPVLAALLSPSCGYCRMLAPVLDQLTRRFLGRFLVAKLDTSRNPLTPSRFHIQGVPALLFFQAGQQIDQLTGAASETVLARKMEEILAR